MIRTLASTYDHKIVVGMPLDKIELTDYDWVWVDFNAPTCEETDYLESYFHFHPLAIEDCVNALQRPKLNDYGQVQFLVLHAMNPKTLQASEVNLFLGSNYIVTYHHTTLEAINFSWKKIQHVHHNHASARGCIAVMHTIIDEIVDQYFPAFFALDDELIKLEKRGKDESIEEIMQHVFSMRRKLLKLWRTVVPMRDLLYRIVCAESLHSLGESKAYFTDIHDHLLKITDMLEAHREMTADLRDSYVSLNSNRMNAVMKTHTVITTVFLPLTLVTGIYGMNFEHMPGLSSEYGHLSIMVFMFVLGGGLVLWFSRRGWFK